MSEEERKEFHEKSPEELKEILDNHRLVFDVVGF
jgi:hypothetical protein